ncbi:MAG: DUF4037 domain-containing protein [Chloroflexia bacterium]|nr:DUF4037 domain-containing protein [Chloroflexia bacterium]
MRTFIPGRELSRRLYEEAVAPIIGRHAPALRYAAALVGPGSEVLGYDTERSTDHGWGARLQLFLAPDVLPEWRSRLLDVIAAELPPTIAGYPTHFRESIAEPGTLIADLPERSAELTGPVRHLISIQTVAAFLDDRLGIRETGSLDAAAWLTMAEQRLLEVTAGRVFRDDLGDLTRARADLARYPDDVWRYRMAAGWKRIAQREAFIGRCGEVGDDLGSQLVALDLIRDVVRLAFLLERRYAPYGKWLGMAFARLPLSDELTPHLDAARVARDWREREAGVVRAVHILAERHNTLGLTPPLSTEPRSYFGRPFQVLFAERFTRALMASITDPALRVLPDLGGIDQFVDSTDALESGALRDWLRQGLRSEDRG